MKKPLNRRPFGPHFSFIGGDERKLAVNKPVNFLPDSPPQPAIPALEPALSERKNTD
jgi:hypothetical protein